MTPLSKRYPLRGRPVLAGLLWSAMFVVLFALLASAMGNPFDRWQQLLVLVVLAVACGQLWSFSMRAALDRRGHGK